VTRQAPRRDERKSGTDYSAYAGIPWPRRASSPPANGSQRARARPAAQPPATAWEPKAVPDGSHAKE
jgi:hypothetical protein